MDIEAKVADLHKRLSVIENERGVLVSWPDDKPRESVAFGKPRLFREDVEVKAMTPSGTWTSTGRSLEWWGEHISEGYWFREKSTGNMITTEQFMEAIRNSDKRKEMAKALEEGMTEIENEKPATDFRVGDLVEVVDEPFPDSQWEVGERFVAKKFVTQLGKVCVADPRCNTIPIRCVRLISRP